MILRALVFAAAVLSPTLASAQPQPPWVASTADIAVATSAGAWVTSSGTWVLGTNGSWVLRTSGGAVTGTSGSMAPGMKPGVRGTPGAKHPYFFAAYAAVWLGLFAYIAWLATRIKTLEETLSGATKRSR